MQQPAQPLQVLQVKGVLRRVMAAIEDAVHPPLVQVAVVEQVAGVAGVVSPKRKPAYAGVIAGTAAPDSKVASDAVTVTGALETLTVPET